MKKSKQKTLFALGLIYGVASLIHFIHNAEFLADYPGLPSSWSRSGVYLTWVGMTLVGGVGWLVMRRGYERAGLVIVAVYAILGMDSLAHYVVAPFSDHSLAMNMTIFLEVLAAGLLLMQTSRLFVLRTLQKPIQI